MLAAVAVAEHPRHDDSAPKCPCKSDEVARDVQIEGHNTHVRSKPVLGNGAEEVERERVLIADEPPLRVDAGGSAEPQVVLPHAVDLPGVAAELEGRVDDKGLHPRRLRRALDEVHVAVGEEERRQRPHADGAPRRGESPASR
eukprot:CAMPEP_0177587028 /NCGR_PEP_ID=MMETSP0419_2-20121207/5408_1 /TAXON_ID=582737 /ORGANISM="Tetraselmis sp., Strain GSL018" /LENGTH=142 /DNA_ID=CAMNT_0019077001 /DNA_START=859 /DNA_END=1284 /DNA_ORIENTATION=+